jgi:RNA polymerase subunit RPABC4/transcription elongation factor Spt4
MDPVIWTLIVVLVPNLIGFIVYIVVRSGKKEELKCPSCGKSVDSEYVKCPYCGKMLKGTCTRCGKVVNPDWESCPYCSTNIDKSNSQYSEVF